VQHDAISVLGQVLLHQSAASHRVKAGVVADHVHLPVAPEPMPQVLQMPYEQLGVATTAFVTINSPLRQLIAPPGSV
jgi:hypothetical protein